MAKVNLDRWQVDISAVVLLAGIANYVVIEKCCHIFRKTVAHGIKKVVRCKLLTDSQASEAGTYKKNEYSATDVTKETMEITLKSDKVKPKSDSKIYSSIRNWKEIFSAILTVKRRKLRVSLHQMSIHMCNCSVTKSLEQKIVSYLPSKCQDARHAFELAYSILASALKWGTYPNGASREVDLNAYVTQTKYDQLEAKLQDIDRKHTEKAEMLEELIMKIQKKLEACIAVLQGSVNSLKFEDEGHTHDLGSIRTQVSLVDQKLKDEIQQIKTQLDEIKDHQKVAIDDIKISISSMKAGKERLTFQTGAQSSEAGMVEILVLLLCTNEKYLKAAAGPIFKLKKEKESLSPIKIKEQRLTSVLECNPENLKGASKVILIPVPEPRGLIISETEPSQLGACYRATKAAGLDIFMIYLSEALEKTIKGLYHSSLEKLLEAQSVIRDMARDNRLISLRFKGDSTPQLNFAQKEALTNWMSY